jgi:hypothetical protein
MPRIADVEVMARLLLDLGAEVEGIGSTTLRIRCANVTKDEPDSTLVGGCAARCCCSDRCWRAAAAPSSRRRAAIFPRGAASRRISKR